LIPAKLRAFGTAWLSCAKGQVEVRALNAHNTFAFAPGHLPTIASTQVTLAPVFSGANRGGPLIGVF